MNYLIAIVLGGLFILLSAGRAPYDDTDLHDGTRSGMALYTDHGTGCQYLSPLFGGLTPRLDGQGNHVGCRR